MPSFGNFLHTQLILRIPKPTTSFSGKTVIVTGASSGLGREAAKHIARLGASNIILACRSLTKGEKTKHEIELSTKCSPSVLEVWELDIESPSSIKTFVEKVNKLPRFDVLISNAGIQTIRFNVVYGTERTMAVNVIGTFLLALQLLPKLRETGKRFGTETHLTFVGSALYDVAKWPEKHGEDFFTWFNDEKNVNKMDQYNLSKLVLLYAIIKLSSIINPLDPTDKSQDSHPIIINSLDPCFCKTNLPGEFTGVIKVLFKVFELCFARSAEEGSRLVVTAASAGRETHGGYMRAGALQAYAPFVTSEEGAERRDYVWEQLGRRLELLQPGILENVNKA